MNNIRKIVYNTCFVIGVVSISVALILISDLLKQKQITDNYALLLFGLGLVLLVPKTYEIEKTLEYRYKSGGRKLYLIELLSGIAVIILFFFK